MCNICYRGIKLSTLWPWVSTNDVNCLHYSPRSLEMMSTVYTTALGLYYKWCHLSTLQPWVSTTNDVNCLHYSPGSLLKMMSTGHSSALGLSLEMMSTGHTPALFLSLQMMSTDHTSTLGLYSNSSPIFMKYSLIKSLSMVLKYSRDIKLVHENK